MKSLIILGFISILFSKVVFGESVKTPPSIENNRIGFVVGSPQEIVMIAKIGGAWARPHSGPFVWQWIEPEKGKFDFSQTDLWVKEAQQNNVAILATIWPYNEWDQNKCHGSECQVSTMDQFYPRGPMDGIPTSRGVPCDSNDYKNFVSKLVERYDGDDLDDMPGLKIPIKYWEIINEPEMHEPFLTFFKGTPQEYVEILKVSKEAIKSADASSMVVQGGAAGISLHMLNYWRKILELGGGNYFDIANIHYIRSGNLDTLNVKDFKNLMEEKGVYKPIWVTEAQYNSEGEVQRSVDGAFKAGASKIFFTQFKIGEFGVPYEGEYSKVYDKIAK